ncbi:hypothetical protein [Actinoplanes sp. ATCC 53533]|uniref:hypothetical protein n=1 Tax=Actinoplanes sp. ATCC 53533 TaxID=1288362 RepID=UPI0013158F4B|nr:hypothetical protein [Actinoplanes sp. ATCC 53533]
MFGGEGGEVLTVDAKTGMLVKDVSTVPGLPQAHTTYESYFWSAWPIQEFSKR